MKKTLKVLSLLCALVLIIGTVSVGMSAYAVSGDILGDYDFEITNVYKDINWSNVTAYKAATHVHTVRSDADTEIDDMIHKYYELGFDAMALTDHGTVNYGWANDQSRVAIFEYQYFVHGPTDEISESDYKNITLGRRTRYINTGKGMIEIPLGNEMNGASVEKYHVNGYYADAAHADLSILDGQDNAIESAIKAYYNAGGFTHINHVGEWSGGNNDPEVYTASFNNTFANYFVNYSPNRGGRGSTEQTNWMNSHKGEAGVIGMELVNTADSRTHNDRRMVYDECLKLLAPRGINMFGFCEDDAHEYSDCDRNAQYFLINNDKVTALTEAEYDRSSAVGSGSSCAYHNDNNDPLDKVQNYYRDAMFYGEFYACSKNSKNTYELGDGFNAVGAYPSVSNISVDQSKNQISITYKDATKLRVVADGEVIETHRTTASQQTVVIDLNRNETKINSYVRIYLTGAGGITYLQPFLVKKVDARNSTVQFITPSADTNIEVMDANGSVVSDSCKYENNYYILPAGRYTYTASRRGYQNKNGEFEVTQADIDNKEQIKIEVELEEISEVSFAYFYAPETIYLKISDDQSFEKYIDRENAINGQLHTDAQSTGNIFFTREDASNIRLTYAAIDGATGIGSMNIGSTSASGNTLATSITSGSVERPLVNGEYVYIKWTITYDYNGLQYKAYQYTYVYETRVDNTTCVGAAARGSTKKTFPGWLHSDMRLVGSLFVTGIHKLESGNGSSYKFLPCNNLALTNTTAVTTDGLGFKYEIYDSSNDGSCHVTSNNTDVAYIYADRSRIQNWSQIPYFNIGLDLNSATQCTGENDSTNPCVRLAFDRTYSDLTDYNANINYLYDLEFQDGGTSYILRKDYHLDTAGYDSTTTGSYSETLASIPDSQRRLYHVDNETSDRKIYKALPPIDAHDTVVPISAYLLGCKEAREEGLWLEVQITLVNINKSSLRTEFNNTVKGCFQEEWFESNAEWVNYQNTIADAGKVLGNPTAEEDEIEEATAALREVVDNFRLKTGIATVEHWWKLGSQTGLIYQETPYEYEYGQDLSASASEIPGYTYANEFESYCENSFVERGTAAFDLEFAEKSSYSWKFYYTPNQYNVTYNSMGADSISTFDATALFGQTYNVATEIPQRTGYSFGGWFLDNTQKNYSAGEAFKWNVAGDGEFFAQWIPNVYNVTYDVNGGNSYSVGTKYKTAIFNDAYSIVPTPPTRTGFAFTGWKLNGDNIYTSGSQVFWNFAADGTFVAQWEVANYTVDFNLMSEDAQFVGNPETAPTISVRYGEPYGTLPDAERTGYTAEWYTDPNYPNSAKVTASTNVLLAMDHTLYAKWVPVNYTITYNLDGGSVAFGTNPTTYNAETDSFTLINPERTGYEFVGWTGTGITGDPQKTVTVTKGSTGARTYTANWDLNGFTIHYTLNGGVNDIRNPEEYRVTSAVTIYPATKAGYTFKGWTDENNNSLGNSFVIPANVPGEKYYTASWQIIDYTIDYDYDGATTTPTNLRAYNVTSGPITINEPERQGYTFQGWDCNYDAFDGTDIVIPTGTAAGNLTFKAIWVENGAYNITYVLNGGTVLGSNPTSYKEGDTRTIISPSKNGYNFAGWTKKVDGKADVPQNTGSVSNQDKGDIIFVANWSVPIIYNISYNGGGVILSDGQNPATYTVETATFTLINPSKTGYTFAGWSGTGLESLYNTVTIPTGSVGDKSFTANWTPNTYTITYDYNGGTGAFITSYTSATNGTIGAPSRLGYTFTGWNISFENFDWESGKITDAGKFAPQTGYFRSDAVVLRSGTTYTIESGVSDLKIYTYNKSGTFLAAYEGSVTPSADCVAYIVAEAASTDSLRSTKLVVSGTPTSYTLVAEDAARIGSAGDMSFKANWSSDTYTIEYVVDAGASWGVDSQNNPLPNPNPTSYNVDTSDILLVNPTKEGYRFIGWEYNGQTTNPTIIPVGSTGPRTYTTRFDFEEYDISYSGIDGATVAANPESYTINDNDIILNNPSKTGYTFEGWIGTGLGGVASKNVTIAHGSTGDREFTATWKALDYTISYSGLEGVTVNNPNSYTIETATFTLNNPVKVGATFEGWSGTDIDGRSTSVTVEKGTTGNRAYTANWSYTQYTIAYDDVPTGQEAINPSTYDLNSPDITLASPSKTGYTFKGWTGTGLDAATVFPVIKSGSTGNRRYRATWQADNYTINYQLAGGEVATNANPASYTIETPTFTLVNPQRTGFTFAGWTGTGLDEATTEVTVPMGSTGPRSYTATWTEVFYTITYTGLENATLASENPSSYTENTTTFFLNNPEKLGYTFVGWSGTGISGSGTSTTVSIEKGSRGDRSYKANWQLETYSIEYVYSGGSEGALKNPTTYTINSAPITLNAPIYTGHEFLGWSSNYYDGYSKDVTINTGERTGNLVFTAVWEVGSYTITVDANGGVLPTITGVTPSISGDTATINYTSDTAEFTIGEPTYPENARTFVGWALEGVPGTLKTITVPRGSTGNKAYTAVWADTANTISYNLNGGELASDNPNEYVTNSGIITLVNPTKAGYKFTGWTFTQKNAGAANYNSLTKTATIDTSYGGWVECTANWDALSYRITYNLNGGNVAAATPNKKTYTFDDEFTLNNPTRNGYIFLGWTGTGLAEGTAHETVSVAKGSSGNRTYTAKWAEESYNITYNYNGGSVHMPNPTSYTVITETFTLNNPQKTGFTFTGWTGTELASAQTIVTIPTGSTGARTYTANFSLDSYTITYYELEGATLSDRVDTYTSETATFSLGTPVKTGYTFLGWMGENDVNPVANVIIATGSSGDKEFTAVWTPTVYNISYELNGGTVAGENRATYTVETPKFTLLNPTKSGYIFAGWTTPDNSTPQTKVSIEKGSTTGDKTFIANWNSAPYSISYTGVPSGSVLSLPSSYTSDAAQPIPNPVVSGYEFRGWTGTGLTEATRDYTIPQGSTGNRILNANWSLIDYTLTINYEGGRATSTVPSTYTVETPTFTLPTPTKTGYRFAGWTGTDITGAAQDVVTIEQGSVGNRTYTATWNERTGDNHLIKFYGYNNAPLYLFTTVNSSGQTVPCNFIEWPIGDELNESIVNENINRINVTVGYQITGWDIDFNASQYRNSDEDVIVHAQWGVGPDEYSITVNGTTNYVETKGQYESFTATTAYSNDAGQLFSYWVAYEVDDSGNIIGTQEIASYYRNYTFYVHSNVVLLAVYGKTEEVRASTRISYIEKYDPNYDWFTPFSERSVATELVLVQHGIIFTTDSTIGSDANAFVCGATNVNNGVSSTKNLSGMWSLSIRNPYKLGTGKTVYIRSYVKVADEDGHITTKYSAVRQYVNNEDTTPYETTEGVGR